MQQVLVSIFSQNPKPTQNTIGKASTTVATAVKHNNALIRLENFFLKSPSTIKKPIRPDTTIPPVISKRDNRMSGQIVQIEQLHWLARERFVVTSKRTRPQ